MIKTISPFNVPLKWHISSMVLPILLIIQLGIMGIPVAVMLLFSLICHEYAHVWVALKQGVYVDSVVVHAFGGAALMKMEDFSPRKEIEMAAAGPLMSFSLAGIGTFLYFCIPHQLTYAFIFINVMFGVFNLLPLYPSDGGRILHALLSIKMNKSKALTTSVIICNVLAIGGIIFCLINGLVWMSIILVLLAALSWQQRGAMKKMGI